VVEHANHVISNWPYAHNDFEDEIFTENALKWDEVLRRKDKPDLIRFMAFPGDEQLDFLEQTIEVVAQAQQEDSVQASGMSEAQRLIEEA
jgi:hypothetical protein